MIRTLMRVIFGFVLACLTAGLTTVLFVTTPGELLSVPSETFPDKAGQTLVWGLLAATHSAIFAAAFALIATGVAEWLGLRSLLYYLVAGAGIALLGFYAQYASEAAGQPTILNSYAGTAFITAGILAGFVYWLAAGRYAGRAKDDEGWDTITEPASADRPQILVETRPATERPKKPSSLAERVSKAEAGKSADDTPKAADKTPEASATIATSVPASKQPVPKPGGTSNGMT